MAESGNPLRVVVFGGIGSGKSTFAEFLAAKGAIVISADRVGHEVLLSDGPAYGAVAARWPHAVVAGEIDRAKLAATVFNDTEQLEELEAITHPLIASRIRQRAAAAGDAPVVVELPLAGKVLGPAWTWVLVDAPGDLRLERAVARGASRDDAAARMAAQPVDGAWHHVADWIVPNTGSIEDLAQAADELWSSLLAA